LNTVLIIGNEGQDGRLLTAVLREQGVRVVGVGRARVNDSSGAVLPKTAVVDYAAIRSLIESIKPDAIFYLAAYHRSSSQAPGKFVEMYSHSNDVHVVGWLNCLEAVAEVIPECRLFYAASSHIFGFPECSPQVESTPAIPRCAYGISKLTAMHCGRYYREQRGLHVSVGILYNHESPLRGPAFISQRIVRGAIAVARGEASELVLGKLDARVDWGYAPDYVDAAVRIVSNDSADDYIVATGIAHTVADFARIAFATVGLKWENFVREDSSIIKRNVGECPLVGNPSKLMRATDWAPTVSFEEMVEILVRSAESGVIHSS